MIKSYFVYITVDHKNQKLYLGCHYGPLDVAEDRYYGSSQAIRNILRARKPNHQLTRFVLAVYATREEMLAGEVFWGNDALQVADDVRFYNRNTCGQGGFHHLRNQCGPDHPRYGVRLSEETKRKISQANAGRKHTLSARQSMSAQRSGEKHWNYGGRWSEDQKARMRESNRKTYERKLRENPEGLRRPPRNTKEWLVRAPSGEEFTIVNLAKHARDNGYHVSGMITKGKSKGWALIRRLDKTQ